MALQKTRINRTMYKEYLDELDPPLASEERILGGKLRKGKFGSAMYRFDNIAFEVGFMEWARKY